MPWDSRAGRRALWLEQDPALGTQTLAEARHRNYPAHRSSTAAASGSPGGAEHPVPGSPSLLHLCPAAWCTARQHAGCSEGSCGVWSKLLFPLNHTARSHVLSLRHLMPLDSPGCVKTEWVTFAAPSPASSASFSFPAWSLRDFPPSKTMLCPRRG